MSRKEKVGRPALIIVFLMVVLTFTPGIASLQEVAIPLAACLAMLFSIVMFYTNPTRMFTIRKKIGPRPKRLRGRQLA